MLDIFSHAKPDSLWSLHTSSSNGANEHETASRYGLAPTQPELNTGSSPFPMKIESDCNAPSPPVPNGLDSPLKTWSPRADLTKFDDREKKVPALLAQVKAHKLSDAAIQLLKRLTGSANVGTNAQWLKLQPWMSDGMRRARTGRRRRGRGLDHARTKALS